MELDLEPLCGWTENEGEVNRIASTLPIPCFTEGTPKGNEPVLLYNILRNIAGEDNLEAQGIGDCVSWGFKRLVDYISAMEIHLQLANAQQNLRAEEFRAEKEKLLYAFEETATEPIYALSRVEYGNLDGSYSDGSVGAWAAKAILEGGTLSRKELERQGLPGRYDPRRAKQWGARGLPDELEPVARKHNVGTVSLVTNFRDAAHLIENGYGVAVCSNVGFENGGRGTTLRDAQGFARARGRWNHCMFFAAVRYDRPGLCCINQWPLGVFAGPLDLGQPKNSFWVDESTVDRMLGQRDSWTASGHKGYPIRRLTYRF